MSQLGLWDEPAPGSRICESCGSAYVPKINHPQCRFCSSDCRYRSKDKRRVDEGVIQTCAQCGAEYLNKSRGQSFHVRKHCSYDCARIARWGPPRTSWPIPWQQCPECGQWLVSTRNRTLCSEECKKKRKIRQIKAHNAKHYVPLKMLNCRECGRDFEQERSKQGRGGSRRTRFCSALCAKRAAKRTERQRITKNGKVESFTLLEIAERDGWRCHICRRKVDRQAWSLDHLIPKSKGGLHVRENVKLAHRRCNSLRGVDRLPAQLLLVG